MNNIKKPQNQILYKAYDKNGNLKGMIKSKQEQNISNDIWLSGVTCFVLNEKNEVLIEKRAKKGITPGKLDLCSGHINGQETPTQAIIRELKEELGIEIEESMNVIKLTQQAFPLIFEDNSKKRNFFINFYCLKRNNSDIKIQKEEVEEIIYLPLQKCFELIQDGKTKFPKYYNYEEIFKKVKNICNNTKTTIERY